MLAVIPRQAGQKESLQIREKIFIRIAMLHPIRSHWSILGSIDEIIFHEKTTRHLTFGESKTQRTKYIKKASSRTGGFVS